MAKGERGRGAWIHALAFAFSAGAHGALASFTPNEAPQRIAAPRVGVAAAVTRARAPLRHVVADARRRAWYDAARADMATGRLALGDTLLRANAIDAYADGDSFDLGAAQRAYATRLASFDAARASAGPRAAAATTFGDLTYSGIPGGRMGDLLLDGRGACEPIAQLVVATAYDAGVGGVGFRFYGGKVGGITHLAPVLDERGAVHDLVSGEPATPGGASFSATGIIEAYARAHGLVGGATPASSDDRGVFTPKGPTRTLAAGYPADATRYLGGFPLYATQAVRAPREPSSSVGTSAALPGSSWARDDFPHCATALRIGTLDPSTTPVATRGGWVSASFERTPRPEALERISSIALELEAFRDDGDVARRVAALACLAGVYQKAARDFALTGKDDVAERAAREARRASDQGAEVLRSLGPEAVDALVASLSRHARGEEWVLLFVPEGATIAVRALAAPTTSAGVESGRILLLAALLVAPETRADALRFVGALDAVDQVEVMHEMFGSQDAARPWAGIYALDAPPGAEEDPFVRGYDVFRGLAWSLWDADRPVDETLFTLRRGLDEAHLPGPLHAAIVEYVVRNTIASAIIRKRERTVLDTLARFVERDPRGAGSHRLIETMRASPTFDLAALADAMRGESVGRARARSDGPSAGTTR